MDTFRATNLFRKIHIITVTLYCLLFHGWQLDLAAATSLSVVICYWPRFHLVIRYTMHERLAVQCCKDNIIVAGWAGGVHCVVYL